MNLRKWERHSTSPFLPPLVSLGFAKMPKNPLKNPPEGRRSRCLLVIRVVGDQATGRVVRRYRLGRIGLSGGLGRADTLHIFGLIPTSSITLTLDTAGRTASEFSGQSAGKHGYPRVEACRSQFWFEHLGKEKE